MKKRVANVKRTTRETDISVRAYLDGQGAACVDTGLPFLDHMLELLAKHSLIDMDIRARGDLHVDHHHTVEDLGITLGEAVNKALGDRKGIGRYGWCILPMDDALARAVLDMGGRPYLVLDIACKRKKILDFDLGLFREFFLGFVTQARMNLHIRQFYGDEPHHAWECVFKALARALRMACMLDARVKGIPSSKGTL